jgi:hypothetical protein
MRLQLSPDLLQMLRSKRASLPTDDLLIKYDAFMLDPGLGPTFILAADGRVLVDGSCWDGSPVREASDEEAIQAIVVGAKKSGIPQLLTLLPTRPSDAQECARCCGKRFAPIVEHHPPDARVPTIVCPACSGLGWRANSAPPG